MIVKKQLIKIFRPVREYAMIDVETSEIADNEIPKTLFWGYADRQGYKRFDSTRNLLDFLRRIPAKTLLHHGDFDIIQLLVDGCECIEILKSHNARLIKCSLLHHYTQNTLRTFPVALAQIFAAFGYEKTSLKNLERRNYEDCVNGLECCLKLDAMFQELTGVSPLATGTIAGTSHKAAELEAGKMPKDLRFLPAYRGGRVEVYNLNEMICSAFDIHSSYSSSIIEAPEQDDLLHVEVKTKDWFCPLFDSRVEDMLFFPNGSFRSFVFRSNLEHYLEPNWAKTSIKILSKHRIDFAWFQTLKHLMLKIYDTKRSAALGVQLCCKFFLNSFYGRIGLRAETERARIFMSEPGEDDCMYYRLPKGRFICFDSLERETRSNYPFATWITDNARARLYAAFVCNRAVYGDTDSIFTQLGQGSFQGRLAKSLGAWGFKGRKSFRARNVKDYEWGDEEVLKGGRQKVIWTLKRFAKGESAALVVRERRTSLRKRLVNPDGTTDPITVN